MRVRRPAVREVAERASALAPPGRRASALVAGLVAVAVVALLAAGCGSSPAPAAGNTPSDPTTSAPTTTVPPTTTTSTTVPPTTSTSTTTTLPTGLQPSAEGAASAFLDGWVAGDRTDSAKVATAAAVVELYAEPYQGQPLVPRGCSAAEFPPVVCSYGPEGGASPTDKLYQITVASHAGGWYVAQVLVEQQG
ncbi:MAG: hypothetical protein ACYCUG_17825 [Acidimicrobiales bacterium]